MLPLARPQEQPQAICIISDYIDRVRNLAFDEEAILQLCRDLRAAWGTGQQVFICGNGGSAANAIHLANDLFYGIGQATGRPGLRAHALCANQSISTCLANDVSYAEIFSDQLKVYARPGDLLIAMSGSGNSPNVLRAVETARQLGVKSYALLGYSGGRCLALADQAIHFAIEDMQVAEDAQSMVGHMVTQWLRVNPPRGELS
jgi:D-sedoheptulose 7-phosphate isomerase